MNKMYKRLTWIPILMMVFTVACSQEEPEVRIVKGEDKEQSTGEQLPEVKADRLLVVELEGMVCVKGCGGTIRKELYASNAVKEVSFEFDEDKTVDIAKVAYDRNRITADEIVAIIAAANEGQFNVIKTRSEAYIDPSIAEDTAEGSDESSTSTEKVIIKTESTASLSSGMFDIFSWF